MEWIEGRYSGRPFDRSSALPPIRNLSYRRVRLTARAIEVIEQHLDRLEDPARERIMVERLKRCLVGSSVPQRVDLRFYTHELRESVRYRLAGYPTGQPDDPDQQHELWNNLHTAALEDYHLREGPRVLYAPEVEALQW